MSEYNDGQDPGQELEEDLQNIINTARNIKNTAEQLKNLSEQSKNPPPSAKKAPNSNNQNPNAPKSDSASTGTSAQNAAETGKSAGSEAGKAAAQKSGETAATAGAEGAATAGAEGAAATAGAEGAAATAGASAGAAAATGGLSLVVQAAILAAKIAIDQVKKSLESDSEDGAYNFKGIIGIIFILFLIISAAALHNVPSASSINYEETQHGNLPDDKRAKNNDRFDAAKKIDKDWDGTQPFHQASDVYIDATETVIERAFYSDVTRIVDGIDSTDIVKNMLNFVKDLFGVPTHDKSKTAKYLYDNVYPYARKSNGGYYSVGDFLASYGYNGGSNDAFEKGNYTAIPTEDLFNDVNYSEIFAVITQGSKYSTDVITLDDYINLFLSKQSTRARMLELKLSDPIFFGSYEVDDGTDSDGNPKKKTINVETDDPTDEELKKCDEVKYYYKITLAPYGLTDLYQVANGLCDSEDNEWGLGDNISECANKAVEIMQKPREHFEKFKNNVDFLDYTEKYDRTLNRMDKNGDGNISEEENYLGPAYNEDRNSKSPRLRTSKFRGHPATPGKPNKTKTGRSSWYYIDIDDMIDIRDLIKAVSEGSDDGGDVEMPDIEVPEDITSLQIYQALLEHGYSADKAAAMALAYHVIEPLYGSNFAVGVMANVQAEGNNGQIEYKNSKAYWRKASPAVIAIAGTTLRQNGPEKVQTLLTGIPAGTEGIGVGMIQWSGGRRVQLLNLYNSSGLGNDGDFSLTDCMQVEISMMVAEFKGSYSSVPSTSAGKNPAECARNVCLHYEIPAHKFTEANVRASNARQIVSAIQNADDYKGDPYNSIHW